MRFKVPVPCKGHEKIAGYKHCDGQYDAGVVGDKRHMSFPLGGMPIKVQAFRILYHFSICLVSQGEEVSHFFVSSPEVNASSTCIYILSLLGSIDSGAFFLHSFLGRKPTFTSGLISLL